MSLEKKIEDLTTAMFANIAVTQELIKIMTNAKVEVLEVQTASVAQAVPVNAPAMAALFPVAPPAPVAMPVQVAAGMPAPPSFMTAPAPVPSVAQAPFSDLSGLLKYAGDAYGVLEKQAPGKGQRMNEVLASIGHVNINDVRPDQFAAVFAGIEALKAS